MVKYLKLERKVMIGDVEAFAEIQIKAENVQVLKQVIDNDGNTWIVTNEYEIKSDCDES